MCNNETSNGDFTIDLGGGASETFMPGIGGAAGSWTYSDGAGHSSVFDTSTMSWQPLDDLITVTSTPLPSLYGAIGFYDGVGGTIGMTTTGQITGSIGVGEGVYIGGGLTSNLADELSGVQLTLPVGPHVAFDPTSLMSGGGLNGEIDVDAGEGVSIGYNFLTINGGNIFYHTNNSDPHGIGHHNEP